MREVIWRPSEARKEAANVTAFLAFLRERGECSASDWDGLYLWSIEHPGVFWAALWDFAGIIADKRWDEPVIGLDKMAPPGEDGPRWFAGANLNYAENLLKFRDEREALVFTNETGRVRSITYRELYSLTWCVARALRAAGVGVGDRIAGFMPNLPETAIAMLATASLGAIWSSCSPDFGVKGVLDRFGQIEPKVLFTADGYLYAGKRIDCLERVRAITTEIPCMERVVVVPYIEDEPSLVGFSNAVLWGDFAGGDGDEVDIEFEQLPFNHPLFIMYSSGTTGAPKCIVHGAGGTLIQHLKELVLHTDLKRDDRIFYFTTCGWMMWNWLVGSLAVGATVLLYDGSPFHPTKDVLFRMAERERMTVFGTSAKYLSHADKEGLEPAKTHDLSQLRAILSTGSPLSPEGFDYVYEKVKNDLCLSSISGGTDIISCFALGNPVGPVVRGELQARGLGMKVEVWDEDGNSIIGKPGELVCAMPFPSMPVSFWGDPDGAKYRAAYFEHYPGVWRHGDWAEVSKGGGMEIYGRSDATLNPGGVRIGTAEIYREVERIDEVIESIVIGQDWQGDTRIVLFVRMRDGAPLSEELKEEMKRQIRENTSPHHVPKKIISVADIPRTISGKISELAVRNVVHGRPVKNTDALANPESLDLFRGLEELKK